tara:strand:- start:122582 stop:123937 length:1356 start_codon:yes stop_codon:yes gene_type:complete
MENKEKGIFEKAGNWVKTSIMLKMVTIGFLLLILLIPENMVESLISERSRARTGVVEEVSSKWGNAQTLTGPVLTIPFNTRVYENGKYYEQKQYAHFLPSDLQVVGAVNPHQKHRGIYEVMLYDADLQVSGSFDKIDLQALNLNDSDMIWDEAKIAIGITDMRGISEVVSVNWQGKKIVMEPGIEMATMLKSGVNGKVDLHSVTQDENGIQNRNAYQPIKFNYPLKVLGSSKLRFAPIGKQTHVKLTSSWADPKFDGAFLPQEPQVNDSGFVADWKVIYHNRNYPQQWLHNKYKFDNSTFGVDLIVPVDEYQKTLRSAKYASLMVLLTFLTFFFIELANGIRIHPLQYVLVGSALVLFYTLLLSISEHFGFNAAYIVSTCLVAGLIGFYSTVIFQERKMASFLTAGLGGIYAFMFFVLNSQDYALLMGSIGLFVILAIVMYATRNIKFYKE